MTEKQFADFIEKGRTAYGAVFILSLEQHFKIGERIHELLTRADVAAEIEKLCEAERKIAPMAMTIPQAAAHVAESKTGIRKAIHQRKLRVHPGPTRKSKHRVLRKELEELFMRGLHKLPNF